MPSHLRFLFTKYTWTPFRRQDIFWTSVDLLSTGWTLANQFQWNSNENNGISIQEITCENVTLKDRHFCRPEYVLRIYSNQPHENRALFPEVQLCSISFGHQSHICINYRQISNIRRTKSQHLKDYRTVLRLSLPNPSKPDVKSRMKM